MSYRSTLKRLTAIWLTNGQQPIKADYELSLDWLEKVRAVEDLVDDGLLEWADPELYDAMDKAGDTYLTVKLTEKGMYEVLS